MIFKDGILEGACHLWRDPYLNSTTILFDIEIYLNLSGKAQFFMIPNSAVLIQRVSQYIESLEVCDDKIITLKPVSISSLAALVRYSQAQKCLQPVSMEFSI